MLFTTHSTHVNCQESFVLWEVLLSKYQFMEKLHIWQNYAHDKDLQLVLHRLEHELNSIISQLEKKCREHSITAPEVGVVNINTSANTEIIRDELIAQDIFIWEQGITESLLRNIRTTTTTDSLRKLFIKITKTNLALLNSIIGYLRLKGWLNLPLIYPNIPPETKEPLNSGEAFHLWDHLTFRYDNIHQTEIYKDMIHDKDFKLLLNLGLQNTLKQQATVLEKECAYFGIPLPKKPSRIVAWPQEFAHFVNDDYVYRILYIGIIGATLLHVSAVKQSVTNDRIRALFIELLEAEINIQDKMISYGKLKGYLNEPPQYNLNT